MTLPFTFGWESSVSISILLLCVVAGLGYYWRHRNTNHRSRKVAMIFTIAAFFFIISMILPRMLRLPALTITTEGIWCAPWSQSIPWEDVTQVSSVTHESTSSTSRYTATTKFDALKLWHRETTGNVNGIEPWSETPNWIRPSIWLTHWSGAAVYGFLNDDHEDPMSYCNLSDLDSPVWEVERLAEVLMKAHQKAQKPEYPNYLEVIRQCESGTRNVNEFCINYIWTQHQRCESQSKLGYSECMKDFFANVDGIND